MSMSYSSPSPGGGGDGNRQRRPYDEQTLIPVTCRMLLRSLPSPSSGGGGGGGGTLTLEDGRELHTVVLVGALRSVDEHSTHMKYAVEDGTGLMEVKQFVDESSDNTFIREQRELVSRMTKYVRVVGQVKEFNDQKNMVGYSVRPLQDHNQLTHHMLQVVACAVRHSKGGPSAAGMMMPRHNIYGTNDPYAMNQHNDYGMNSRHPIHAITSGDMGHQGGFSAGAGAGAGGNDLDERVYHFFKMEGAKHEQGGDVNECIASLRGQYPEGAIRNTIENLCGDGRIYSTVDNTKYNTCD